MAGFIRCCRGKIVVFSKVLFHRIGLLSLYFISLENERGVSSFCYILNPSPT